MPNKKLKDIRSIVVTRYKGEIKTENVIGTKIVETIIPKYPLYPSGTLLIRLGTECSAKVPRNIIPIYVESDLFTPYCLSSSYPDTIVCIPRSVRDKTYYIPAGYSNRSVCYSVLETKMVTLKPKY